MNPTFNWKLKFNQVSVQVDLSVISQFNGVWEELCLFKTKYFDICNKNQG